MSRPPLFFLACLVAWSASCEKGHDAVGTRDGGPNDDASNEGSVNVATLGDRFIGRLSAVEAEAVCQEELRRSDPCLENAIATTASPDTCNAAVSACRATLTDPRSMTTCEHASLDAVFDCPVTVAEYLACLDAFRAALNCDFAGSAVGTPDECAHLAATCGPLANAFGVPGAPRPCSPEESQDAPSHTGDDIYGADGCRPIPARFVILGDSIAACWGVPDTALCSSFLVADYVKSRYAPGVQVETHAVAGARVGDLASQAAGVAAGPGHVFVFVFAIGNDFLSGDFDVPSLSAEYQAFLDAFADATRFPDGVTFLLNTQYALYDQCAAPGASGGTNVLAVTPALLAASQGVILDAAELRSDTVAVDQYWDFLGHGRNANVGGCPYCGPDNTSWLADLLHPNEVGHAHLASKWYPAIDAMLGATCHGG